MMDGLNHEAVAEMLAEYFAIDKKIRLIRHSSTYLLSPEAKLKVLNRLEELTADRDFVLQTLQDEYVLGLWPGKVAVDFGLSVTRSLNLACPDRQLKK